MALARRIDEIFQKESDPFTTNEGMLEVINTIRFRHFDKAVEVRTFRHAAAAAVVLVSAGFFAM